MVVYIIFCMPVSSLLCLLVFLPFPLFRKIFSVGFNKTFLSVAYKVGAVRFLQSLDDPPLIVGTEIL